MNKRMKQKLLYQIGLISDPWKVDDDKIHDDKFSQDSKDRHAIIMYKRAKSFDNWEDNLIKHNPLSLEKENDPDPEVKRSKTP